MTKEDEARLAHHRSMGGGCNHEDKRALLRIIDGLIAERGDWAEKFYFVSSRSDEQAARVAALTAAGNALAECVDHAGPNKATVDTWQAAIRASAETPRGTRVTNFDGEVEYHSFGPVAPGEVKP